MANIKPYTDEIANAVYGEEVRSSIINALNKVNDDNNSYQDIKNQIVASKDDVNEAVTEFDAKVASAQDATTALIDATSKGNTAKSALDSAITSANTARTNLVSATSSANNAESTLKSATSTAQTATASANDVKKNLDSSISSANSAKSALDTAISNAKTAKSNLDTSTSTGNTAKNNLDTAISNARGYKVTYTDAWCATFVSAVAVKLGYTRIIPTECSCNYMIRGFQSIGCWVENDAYVPKAGDVIFYDWQDIGIGDNVGSSDHVGIVEKCDGRTITVIEGNISNKVGRRTLAVNGKYIRGFGVPAYTTQSASTPAPSTTKKDITTIAKEVLAGQWGNGDDRKNRLTSAGYDYATVQAKVNELASGKTSTPTKSVAEVAKEVLAGKWGNGTARKTALENAGYNYSEVQQKVNELCGQKSVTEVAKEVIQGKWGNGATRKSKLEQAGYNYSAVQAEVNRLLH